MTILTKNLQEMLRVIEKSPDKKLLVPILEFVTQLLIDADSDRFNGAKLDRQLLFKNLIIEVHYDKKDQRNGKSGKSNTSGSVWS